MADDQGARKIEVYGSMEGVEEDIKSWGFRFKEVKRYPNAKQANSWLKQADTVRWIKWQNIPDDLRVHLLGQMRGTPYAILLFGITTCPVILSGKFNRTTKFGVKTFLFRPTECGICFQGLPVTNATTCLLCGFTICTVCAIKMALKNVDLSNGKSFVKCSKCQRTFNFKIIESLDLIAMEESVKFNQEEDEMILNLMAMHHNHDEEQEAFTEEQIKTMNEFTRNRKNVNLNEALGFIDLTKCAYCDREFRSKRSKCSGCGNVAYCNAKCQKKHWKIHKNICKFLKTFNSGPQ